MITESHVERSGAEILLRLAIGGTAVIDVLTDDATLAACRELLRGSSRAGRQNVRMGSFGSFDVTMAVHAKASTVSLFVDGPDLDDRFRGNQSAGVYVDREELLSVLDRHAPEAL